MEPQPTGSPNGNTPGRSPHNNLPSETPGEKTPGDGSDSGTTGNVSPGNTSGNDTHGSESATTNGNINKPVSVPLSPAPQGYPQSGYPQHGQPNGNSDVVNIIDASGLDDEYVLANGHGAKVNTGGISTMSYFKSLLKGIIK